VEPVTHALTSLAIARTAQKRLPRFGTAMIVAAGVAADLDFASYVGGPAAFLRFHRTVLHSLLGSAVMACTIAWIFLVAAKRIPQKPASPSMSLPSLKFSTAIVFCSIGAAGHLLLDVASGVGVQLLWPFHSGWFAWDLLTNLDPLILVGSIAGLLLPLLFRLISDEIGDRRKKPTGVAAAIVTLFLLFAYIGARNIFRVQTTDLLLSREFHNREALSGASFPYSTTPFEWRGIVTTDNTVELVDVPIGDEKDFDPDRSVTRYKPDGSLALEKVQSTAAAEQFLKYARFPIANAARIEEGYRIEIHDLRFAPDDTSLDNIFIRVDLDSSLRITSQGFHFASSPNP
jgi:membrane-bound metal-dependent hydrolase YbcI (DUF457 family)